MISARTSEVDMMFCYSIQTVDVRVRLRKRLTACLSNCSVSTFNPTNNHVHSKSSLISRISTPLSYFQISYTMQSMATPVMASLSSKLLWPSCSSRVTQSPSHIPCCYPSIQCSAAAQSEDSPMVGRRELLLGGAAATSLALQLGVSSSPAEAYTQVEVGTFLPPAEGNSEFVQFVAKAQDTPALRAGNVEPYKFILPPTWKQVRIANILSGNYCQPKCAEPWVEVKFENAKEGTVQVVASPMVRLSNKPNATIEEIGNPEKIISALGPFVTGNSYDPDEVMETTVDHKGDLTYYSYQLDTPFAKTGSHNLATATAKGNVVLLCVVSANDKQWAASEDLLKTILKSFSA